MEHSKIGKAYQGHEIIYREMKRTGIRSWAERERSPLPSQRCEIDPDSERCLRDILAQPWAPRAGKVIELGCGTAPMLRWFCDKGFSGVGIDVSKTAIAMAQEQSRNYPIEFHRGDVCQQLPLKLNSFDIVLDGHCLHCLYDHKDRQLLLKNAYSLLREGGLFIVLTMCAPVDRKAFAKLLPRQKLIQNVVYVPHGQAWRFQDARCIDGTIYLPTRMIIYWRTILSELRKNGFFIQWFRFNRNTVQEPNSDLAVAALVR